MERSDGKGKNPGTNHQNAQQDSGGTRWDIRNTGAKQNKAMKNEVESADNLTAHLLRTTMLYLCRKILPTSIIQYFNPRNVTYVIRNIEQILYNENMKIS